jgi:hypothetical protein
MEMIYRNIEKLVLKYSNNMELGEKLRELYWKEREENDKDLLEQGFDNTTIDDESDLKPKGSYKDELPPLDYQLDN